MLKMIFLSVFVLTLTLGGSALGAEVRITSSTDFIVFINNVNGGSSTYSGTTVFLDTDLSFYGIISIDSIGKDSSNQFLGVFDGQGHVISDFKTSQNLQYTGVFGYSTGLTIRNVVIDSSCSITSSYSGSSNAYVGGTIGFLTGGTEACIIENIVNMATITFNSMTTINSIMLGGIAGDLSTTPTEKNAIVKNCVNYGFITFSGSNSNSLIGGVVGNAGYTGNKYLQNCANYGTITHSGTSTSTLNIGGIVGWSTQTQVENCLSAGIITLSNSGRTGNIGTIVGFIESNTYITYCYFTMDTGITKINGGGSIYDKTGTSASASAVDSTLVSNLNSQVTAENGFNKWIHNQNNATVTFKVNNNKGFSLSSQVILLPSLSFDDSVKFIFVGWFTDDLFTTPFTANSISESITLYGLHGTKVVVTFNANGGDATSNSKMISFNSPYGELPTPTKEGFTFLGWFTENDEEVTNASIVNTPNDHTLFAKWIINKYTISFESNGGSECSDITQDYDTPLTLPKPNRTGYTFVHWCSDPSLSTEYIGTTMPGENTILYGKWTPNNYIVTFNANGGIETFQSKRVTFGNTYGELIILPTPTKEGFTFVGWFTENSEEVTSESIVNIPNDHTLFAQWAISKCTILFESNGGGECSDITQNYGTPLTLPKPNRTGYTFVHWCSDPSLSTEYTKTTMSAENTTLYGKWTPNNYTVTFNSNGGIETFESIRVTFGSPYGELIRLPTPTKEGFTFLGWFTENNESVTGETIVSIPNDHTLYAHWEEIPTMNVEIVFETKDLSYEEIKEIIEKYTDDKEFSITKIEEDGELRVIVAFKDAEAASSFVDNIRAGSETSVIRKVGFIHGEAGSFSTTFDPFLFLSIFIF